MNNRVDDNGLPLVRKRRAMLGHRDCRDSCHAGGRALASISLLWAVGDIAWASINRAIQRNGAGWRRSSTASQQLSRRSTSAGSGGGGTRTPG